MTLIYELDLGILKKYLHTKTASLRHGCRKLDPNRLASGSEKLKTDVAYSKRLVYCSQAAAATACGKVTFVTSGCVHFPSARSVYACSAADPLAPNVAHIMHCTASVRSSIVRVRNDTLFIIYLFKSFTVAYNGYIIHCVNTTTARYQGKALTDTSTKRKHIKKSHQNQTH